MPDDYSVGCMLDACTKPCHFASAGRAQRDLAPSSSSYLGVEAHRVVADYDSGVLVSKAQERYRQHCATAAVDDGCPHHFTCSRPSASARGMVDIAGLATVLCPHTHPARNGTIPMLTPEQHDYHIRNASNLLLQRPDIRDLYIDIGCKIEGTLRASLQSLVDGNDLHPSVLKKVGDLDAHHLLNLSIRESQRHSLHAGCS